MGELLTLYNPATHGPMSTWKARRSLIVIWSVGALVTLGLSVAVVLSAGLGGKCILLLWLWTVINLIQVARGKRRQLWV